MCLVSGIFMPAIRATYISSIESWRSVRLPFGLALTLLVTRVSADHPNNTVAANYLAVPADFLYGCSYFHELSPSKSEDSA
jgi:hypothetical protein